jgi:glycosyltransferase involved in cell wall biosynthesis
MVITDRCEIAHLVQGRVADVVPFDATAFAGAMGRLLTSRERYQRYRGNCQALLSDTFSLEITVDRLESLYRRVVAEK